MKNPTIRKRKQGDETMLNPLPVEMSDGALEKIYPELGAGESRWPLEELYPLLEELNAALTANMGHPVYNPA